MLKCERELKAVKAKHILLNQKIIEIIQKEISFFYHFRGHESFNLFDSCQYNEMLGGEFGSVCLSVLLKMILLEYILCSPIVLLIIAWEV